jgi:hypothetical protein
MTFFDRRHRWGAPIEDGARITRTCGVCGLTKTYETMLPRGYVDALYRLAIAPNPYRRLVIR